MAIKNLLSILTQTTKLPEADIKAAIENTEEVELTVPKLVVRTEADEASLQESIKLEKKASWDGAVETTEKRLVQAELDAIGLPTALEQKGKTLANLRDIYKSHFVKEAGIAPDKRVKELESDLEKMRGNYSTLEGQFNEFKTKAAQEAEVRQLDSMIAASLPEKTEFVIPMTDLMLIVKNRQRFKMDNGIAVGLDQAGEVIKNTTDLKPKAVTEIVHELVKPYIKPVTGGSGKADEKGGGATGSYEAFVKEMEARNITEGSVEFNAEAKRRLEAKTLIM